MSQLNDLSDSATINFVSNESDSVSKRVISRGETPASVWNIANQVTITRILLVPVFVAVILLDGQEYGWLRYLAAAIFIIAMATDSVDGSLARDRNLITNTGKILDPIADKFMIGAGLIMLSVLGELSWWITGIILLRELGITVYRMVVIPKKVIAAGALGKLKTVFQTIAISFYLVPLWTIFGDWLHWVNFGLMLIALALTLWSAWGYLVPQKKKTSFEPGA